MAHVTQEELAEINELRNKIATVVSESGQATLQIALFDADITELRDKLEENTRIFKQLLDDEQILIKRLSDKYGVGSINFDTGEFTPEK
jgi:chaperonin cofactor prefoldin